MLLDDRVHVGDGDQDFYGTIGHDFDNRKLVEIARIIVVYGAPYKVPEITRRFLCSRCRSANSVELPACLEREVGKKSPFKHRPTGNSSQDRALLSIVSIHHIFTLL